MKTKIIAQIKEFLDEREKVFLNEKDIQLYIAQKFKESNEYDNVFMEYCISKEVLDEFGINYWSNKNNIYVDIVLERNGLFYPIEIKYKTKKQELDYSIFGKDVKVELKEQGAQDIGRYDFWKDVKRVEFLLKCPSVREGCVLFITNDSHYQVNSVERNVGYANFSMHQGRVINEKNQTEILDWKNGVSISKGRPKIELKNYYKINWFEMKNINSEITFKYILL